jgi:hypothetical protein
MRSEKEDVMKYRLRYPLIYSLLLKITIVSFRASLRLILGKKRRDSILEKLFVYRYLLKKRSNEFSGTEDYDHHWNYADFKGKVIVDVGADWGSTAKYFLDKGAKYVIGVEGDSMLARQLFRNTKSMDKLIPIRLWINKPQFFEFLIRKFKPDILKVDCEGCEVHLCRVKDKIFSTVKEYLVETHNAHLFNLFNKKLATNNYNIDKEVKIVSNIIIVHAKKKG